jgi:hypothetical protein
VYLEIPELKTPGLCLTSVTAEVKTNRPAQRVSTASVVLIILIKQTCSFFFKITPDLLFNQVLKFGFVGAADSTDCISTARVPA